MKIRLNIIFLLIVPFCGYAQILKENLDDKMLVLTFDDATASQYSIVAPLLKQHGFGATFFICEFQPNFSDSSKYMNWRQIKELDKMGFELANHTRSHPNVGALNKVNFLNAVLLQPPTDQQREWIEAFGLSWRWTDVLYKSEFSVEVLRSGFEDSSDKNADHTIN